MWKAHKGLSIIVSNTFIRNSQRSVQSLFHNDKPKEYASINHKDKEDEGWGESVRTKTPACHLLFQLIVKCAMSVYVSKYVSMCVCMCVCWRERKVKERKIEKDNEKERESERKCERERESGSIFLPLH